jgi:hypothetical protein
MSAVAPFDRIDQLTRSPRPEATWWVALVQALDRLDERILEHRANHPRLHSQLTNDAPHLADRATTMDRELDGVGQRVRAARSLVGERAGDPAAVREASRVTAEVARRLRRWEQRASDLLHNAYRVDIGGE